MDNPFSTQTNEINIEKIADRGKEARKLTKHVVNRRNNILLTGEHGVGKTCVLKKIRNNICENDDIEDSDILTIETRDVQFHPEEFIENIIVSLFKLACGTTEGISWSNLIRESLRPDSIDAGSGNDVDKIKNYYLFFRSKNHSFGKSSEDTYGFKKWVQGVTTKGSSEQYTVDNLESFEYDQIIEELVSIIKGNGIGRVFIFADEANHIDPEIQVSIFRNHLETFLEKDIQFVFTAGQRLLEREPDIDAAFPFHWELSRFDPDDMNSLIETYMSMSSASFNFSDRALNKIWKVSQGHPRKIQKICRESFYIACDRNLSEITSDVVFNSCIKIFDF